MSIMIDSVAADLAGGEGSERARFLCRLNRACAGCSAREVGRRVGIPGETARRYLRGQSSPPLTFIVAVCYHFNVTADWLVLGVEPRLSRERRVYSLAAAPADDLLRALSVVVKRMRPPRTRRADKQAGPAQKRSEVGPAPAHTPKLPRLRRRPHSRASALLLA